MGGSHSHTPDVGWSIEQKKTEVDILPTTKKNWAASNEEMETTRKATITTTQPCCRSYLKIYRADVEKIRVEGQRGQVTLVALEVNHRASNPAFLAYIVVHRVVCSLYWWYGVGRIVSKYTRRGHDGVCYFKGTGSGVQPGLHNGAQEAKLKLAPTILFALTIADQGYFLSGLDIQTWVGGVFTASL